MSPDKDAIVEAISLLYAVLMDGGDSPQLRAVIRDFLDRETEPILSGPSQGRRGR